MNAIELIERVREHRAELAADGDRLVVRGSGDPLPDDLQAEIRAHKAELMVALGTPIDVTVAGVLEEIRPHLARSLRDLTDNKLLVLVNWAIITAWFTGVRKLELDQQAGSRDGRGR